MQYKSGFQTGIAIKGIDSSRALSIRPKESAYVSLAMGMNGVTSAVVTPVICH
ncbi:LrgB family protein [Polynucleobacter sp. UB-Piko-W3]|nr:LrgB family protein [Polynucleobacter sp. UB-Piko-W3]